MKSDHALTHASHRACAHFSMISLLSLVSASIAFTSALQAAPEAAKTETAKGAAQRPAERENLKSDQRHPPTPLALFDTNHDGRISPAEIAAAPALLRKLDTNGDGQLTGRELQPPRPPRPPGAPDDPPDGARGESSPVGQRQR